MADKAARIGNVNCIMKLACKLIIYRVKNNLKSRAEQ